MAPLDARLHSTPVTQVFDLEGKRLKEATDPLVTFSRAHKISSGCKLMILNKIGRGERI
jgi:hypothetical protein